MSVLVLLNPNLRDSPSLHSISLLPPYARASLSTLTPTPLPQSEGKRYKIKAKSIRKRCREQQHKPFSKPSQGEGKEVFVDGKVLLHEGEGCFAGMRVNCVR